MALKESHFRVVAAVDSDPAACETYETNHPTVRLFREDIRTLNPETVKQECLGKEHLDLMVICAPCQPFSSQNKNRSKQDKRARLLLDGAKFVAILKPRIVFVENVPGLTSEKYCELLKEFKKTCGKQYIFGAPTRIDAADYGVPQRRIRCLWIGTRSQKPPEFSEPTTPIGRRRTVRDAIKFLKPLSSGEFDPDDPMHFARVHRPIATKRLKAIPKDGGSREALPSKLRLKCHTSRTSFSDVYGRMKWDDVAPTLTTGCTDVTKGRFAHPNDDRAISLREASLLQTFPLKYKFRGSSRVIASQIGNAIPCALVKAMTPCFRQVIKGKI